MSRAVLASIRVRLVVGSAAVAAIVLSLLAVLIAMQVTGAAHATATRLAGDDLLPFAADLRMQPEEHPDLPAAGLLVVVQAPDGSVQRDSMTPALSAAARKVVGIGDVAVRAGEFRVVRLDVSNSIGVWHLWAARDVTASDDLLRGVALSMLIGVPVAVLLTALTAWLVAGGALRPVGRMRMTADRLRAAGSTGLLPAHGGGELADLATTLNGLIADLRAGVAHERRVTADAAHELRTPLAVLAAQVELAERRLDTVDLEPIRISVDRLTRLTDDLLALSRVDADRDGTPPSAPVSELVTETMGAVDRGRLLAPAAVLVDLELAAPLDETRTAPIDVTSFGRILSNLIGNALAAPPATAVLVRLSIDGDALVLEVLDDGPGLPPDFLPFAFDRFARPEGARSSGSSGAGLGLALVQRLAERSGGAAGLANRRDGGAVATVRLPLR